MLNLRQIEVFRAVMIAKTVSGAARMLHTSQPGLSRMLRHMEDRLGFLLFDRSGGRLVPTREAKMLFEEVERIHKALADLDHFSASLARGEDELFRIGASPSLGHSIVPKILKDLTERFPRLLLQFDILSVEQVVDYLVMHVGACTLTLFPIDHPNIVSERIGRTEMVCVVPADHAWADRSTIRLDELIDQPLISFQDETPHGQVIAQMYARAGLKRKVATYVRFAETACAFVRSGFGITIVDAFTADQGIGNARTLRITSTGEMQVFLHRNRHSAHSRISKQFACEARRQVKLSVDALNIG
ncbi:LysR substrate-binding domain-containing protein [Methylobacterium sp. J-068]|uniref:LysR substrate-binding domain-containing protein n=1 Tax=Methylobacterium sp. J-068 TaxID=2836649 RepID=UPI001FB8CAA4|nr:LysR substrate-binding domain-containing protein [Methylobacterium sp. J-068]MCJ2032991.1 LysR substrate-binding domain-containing protein [Methylobacterium sp. J-068]